MFEASNEVAYRVYRVVDDSGFPQHLVPSGRVFPLKNAPLAEQLPDLLQARELPAGDYVFYPEHELVEVALVHEAHLTRVGDVEYERTVGDRGRPKPEPGAGAAAVKQYVDAHPHPDVERRYHGLHDEPVWAAFEAANRVVIGDVVILKQDIPSDMPCPEQDHAPCDRNGPSCLPF